MEGKGIRINMGKTKVLISGPGLDVLQKSDKDLCGVCLKGVGTDSNFLLILAHFPSPPEEEITIHASGVPCWAPSSSNLYRLHRTDRAIICWMCSITTKGKVSLQDLLQRMQLDDLAKVLHSRQLR